MDITPQRARAYKHRIVALETELQALKEENEFLKGQLYRKDIPERIREWMKEYDLPIWEAFYCHQHKQFYVELDTAFPYHLEGCRCECC